MALVAGLACLALTACGDRDDSDDNDAAEPTTSETVESESSEPAEEQFPDFKACMVSDSGGFDDKSFNQTAHDGLISAQETWGIQTAEAESQADTEYADNIAALVNEGCNQITTVGFLLGDATEAAAKKSKDVDFAIIDYGYEKPPANLKGLTFDTAQPSYLAGYLAAAESESGVVGTFGGLNIPTVTIFMEGFRQGIDAYNAEAGTEVKLLGWDGKDGSFTEDFEDKSKGQAIAQQMIQQGADIIFPYAGPAGLGGLQAAKDADARGIWVDTDGCIGRRVLRHPADLGHEARRRGDRDRDQGVDRRHVQQRPVRRLIALSTRLISACRSTSRSTATTGDACRSILSVWCFSSASTAEVRHPRRRAPRDRRASLRQRRRTSLGARQRSSRSTSDGQTVDLLEHAADDAAVGALRRGGSRSPTSPTLRIAVSGVRSSCETSAVNRRI